uniref:Uncharacterized protein n=1 Tax=Sphenodon punctatus TaxID=8508 RepID=A0A8D0LBF9_SPHPU
MGNQGLFATEFLLFGLFQMLSQGSTQGGSGSGPCLTDTLGREFVTAYMENYDSTPSESEVQIHGYSASTSVWISDGSFNTSINVRQGEMVRVKLPPSVEILGNEKFSNVIRIKADNDITVVSFNNEEFSSETTVLYPVPVLGNEYYIVTPPSSGRREFSIMTHKEPSTIEIHVKGQLTFQGQEYNNGDTLNFTLPAFQVIQLQSTEDLSGTRIVAQKPVAVLAGHVCASDNTNCNHIFEQLLPVCSWGRTYIVPPVPFQRKHDIVYVSASQPTAVQYWLGGQQSNTSLEGGQVLQFEFNTSCPVYITTSAGVQVMYYSTGSAFKRYSYDTFLINIPDVNSYCLSYTVNGQVGFDNYILLVAKTSETEAITLDKQPLRNATWTQVPGTEFSWGMVNTSGSHNVAHPSSPFGILSFGTAERNSYGSSGACARKAEVFTCQVDFRHQEEQFKKCRNGSMPGHLNTNSPICSSVNSTIAGLKSICRRRSMEGSLKDAAQMFESIVNNSTLLTGGSEEEVATAVTVRLWAVEKLVLAAALRSPEKNQTLTTESMDIETRRITRNCSRDIEVFVLRAKEEMMDIHCETVAEASTQGHGVVALISYSDVVSILSKTFHDEEALSLGRKYNLNSRVISGAVGDGKPITLPRAANFTLRHRQINAAKEEVLCVYWNHESGNSTWSPSGCEVLHTNGTHTTCSCHHLSSFALLMASTDMEEDFTLTIITYVGLSLSLVCLLLAILTFLLCRPIQNVTTSIHLQLCLCLFLADLLFLSAVKLGIIHKVTCAVIAGLLHFLYLSCFTWMFLEGLHLFLMVRNLKVVNYTSASRFKKRYMYPFGYGFAALMVAISASVNPGGYGTDRHCWLSYDRGFVWSFLGPVCAIILVGTSPKHSASTSAP